MARALTDPAARGRFAVAIAAISHAMPRRVAKWQQLNKLKQKGPNKMNTKVNEMATAYDAANERLREVEKHIRRERGKLVGDVAAYLKANDDYAKALEALRDAVGVRAMCGFVGDDGAKSAAEFFRDFPNK